MAWKSVGGVGGSAQVAGLRVRVMVSMWIAIVQKS